MSEETIATEDAPAVPMFRGSAEESVERYLAEIVRHWEGVRSGSDVEALHDMRVATRRLRAALSVFEPAFPVKPFQRFERKISYLTDALGEARDTDVFLEFLSKEMGGLPPESASELVGLESLAGHLKSIRAEQQTALLKTLRRLDPEELRRDADALLSGSRSAAEEAS